MAQFNKSIQHIAYTILMACAVFTNFAQQAPSAPQAQAAPAATNGQAPQTSGPAQVAQPPAEPVGKTLKIINGSSWTMSVNYVSPQDSKINTTIENHTSETIISKDGLISYALRKEKIQTPDKVTPMGEGEFRIDDNDELIRAELEKLHARQQQVQAQSPAPEKKP